MGPLLDVRRPVHYQHTTLNIIAAVFQTNSKTNWDFAAYGKPYSQANSAHHAAYLAADFHPDWPLATDGQTYCKANKKADGKADHAAYPEAHRTADWKADHAAYHEAHRTADWKADPNANHPHHSATTHTPTITYAVFC
jgi:hypothetical protein